MNNERDMALRWFDGNAEVVAFFDQIASATQIGDDLVDEDLTLAERSNLMARLFERLLALPSNPFYAQHYQQLCPLILTGVFQWDSSNMWQHSASRESRIFGYVRREALEALIVHCAYLCKGAEWAMTVDRELHEFYHIEHSAGETLESWSRENG